MISDPETAVAATFSPAVIYREKKVRLVHCFISLDRKGVKITETSPVLQYVIFNPLYTNEFFYLVRYNETGITGKIFLINMYFSPRIIVIILANMTKYQVLWHFIWDITVCKSILLGVSSIKVI